MHKRIAFCTLLLISIAVLTAAAQQDKSKRPSPPAQTDCALANGTKIHVDYSSPRMNGRQIYGGLVPYGEVWRAGANEATTFVISGDVSVAGKSVPAGKYTIFVVPAADKWTLIVNKKTGEWGIPYKYESDELVRADMTVSKLNSPVEDFTIGFDHAGGTCTLHMDWETTRASIVISGR
jgi:hypothetical protein